MTKKLKKNYYDTTSERIVKVIPLGGLEQIGMNMTAFEYGNSIIVADCGLAFPDDNMPGVDHVVPDVTYLKENIDLVRAFFITHGHEDHIGALPYVLKDVKVPVYATRLTAAIIRNKLDEFEETGDYSIQEVKTGDIITAGDFKVEFIHVNHSIKDAAALAITSPAGTIIHTGDFKIDYTPLSGPPADLQRFGELGKKGVLALLSDSTNALRPGFTPSEQNVAEFFTETFRKYRKNRLLVGTFASNLNRVQLIIDLASKNGRCVAVEGRSMLKIIEIAKELGYLDVPAGVLVDVEEMKNIPPERLCILMTGSQGEALAALTRVASGQHKLISVDKNDVVVFSSTPIPGNERAVNRVINGLAKRGAHIINRATHVSGHACEEELKLIYQLTRPKYAIPMHGEFYYRQANRDIAVKMGVPEEQVILADSGDVISLSEKQGEITGHVTSGIVMVDGLGVGDVGNAVLRDRHSLSLDGIVVASVTVQRGSGELLGAPEIVSKGFVYVRDAEDILSEAGRIVTETVENAAGKETNPADIKKLKAEIKDGLSAFFWSKVKRNPVILPIVMIVDA